MSKPTEHRLSKSSDNFMTSMLQSALWALRRFDYYVNGSVVSLNNPNHYQDPYKTFNTLRSRNPVLRNASNQGWFITGYPEIQALLLDQRVSADIRSNRFFVRLLRFAIGEGEIPLIDNPTMLNQDAPDHSRLRRLVIQGFTHKYVQSLAPLITELVQEHLDQIQSPEFDLLKSLAQPLPAIVIAEMMGVPQRDREKFEAWSEGLLGLSEIRQPKLLKGAAQANQEMRAYLAELLKSKPLSEDLISRLLEARSEEDKLSLAEIYSTCVLLLTAGHETTTRLIGNCVYQLLSHPKQLAEIKADRSLIPLALEETLRFEPPVQNTVRFVKESFRFQGKHFRKGQLLLLCFAAANRDPRVNADPDVFNIHRWDAKHMGFGHGSHLCIGISLARLEAEIAINALLDKFPNLQLADTKPAWGTHDFFRGLRHLNLKT